MTYPHINQHTNLNDRTNPGYVMINGDIFFFFKYLHTYMLGFKMGTLLDYLIFFKEIK